MELNIIHAEDGQHRHRSRRWISQQDLGVFSFPVPQYGNLTYTIDSRSGSANPRQSSHGLEVKTLVAESG
jgi:hypothetical protein